MAGPLGDLGNDRLLRVAAHASGVDHESNIKSTEKLMGGAPPPLEATRLSAAELLPRYIILKSDRAQEYLRHIDGVKEAPPSLKFSGPNQDVKATSIRFEVEVEQSDKRYIHIRSCYNNKYWVMQNPASELINATAERPEKAIVDLCTLFEPISMDTQKKTMRLRHVSTGNYTAVWPVGHKHELCLHASPPKDNNGDLYTYIDWETILILPKRIVLKGDNNKYIQACLQGGPDWFEYTLNFTSSKITDIEVINEVVPAADGYVLIRNEYFNMYWMHSTKNDWVMLKYSGDDHITDHMLFKPKHLLDNMIVLLNKGSGKYCRRLDNNEDTLSASNRSMDIFSRLVVEEPVTYRVIERVKFREQDARIHEPTVIASDPQYMTNHYEDKVWTTTASFKTTDTRSSTWKTSTGLKLGVSMTISAGIPLIGEAGVTISGEINRSTEWGKTMTSTVELETKFSASVPPMTTLKVTLLATRGSCDVPFSYVQRDTLVNGDEVTTEMDGGVYSGVNDFYLKYEAEKVPFDPTHAG